MTFEDRLKEIAGKNTLYTRSSDIEKLVQCCFYLATQLNITVCRLTDDNNHKGYAEETSEILGHAEEILTT